MLTFAKRDGERMFCMKCGKELPNKAKFCSRCGEKTDFSEAKPVPKVAETINSALEEELKFNRQNTLNKLNDELDDLESRKTGCSFIYIAITVVAAIISFSGFSSMNGELSNDTIPSMMTGLLSGAVALGMFFGTLISNARTNEIIEKKKHKIEEFKRENDMK